MNNLETWMAWAQIAALALALAALLIPLWLYLRRRPEDRLGRRRSLGLFLYGLAALLAAALLNDRSASVRAPLDVLAWFVVFLGLSFLVWLVASTLVFRFLERRAG